MDAHKALITDIFNNSTLLKSPFFRDLMFGRKICGPDCLRIWNMW